MPSPLVSPNEKRDRGFECILQSGYFKYDASESMKQGEARQRSVKRQCRGGDVIMQIDTTSDYEKAYTWLADRFIGIDNGVAALSRWITGDSKYNPNASIGYFFNTTWSKTVMSWRESQPSNI